MKKTMKKMTKKNPICEPRKSVMAENRSWIAAAIAAEAADEGKATKLPNAAAKESTAASKLTHANEGKAFKPPDTASGDLAEDAKESTDLKDASKKSTAAFKSPDAAREDLEDAAAGKKPPADHRKVPPRRNTQVLNDQKREAIRAAAELRAEEAEKAECLAASKEAKADDDTETESESGTKAPEDRPSGDCPSGDRPSGDRPSGDRPSGDRPSGDRPSVKRKPPSPLFGIPSGTNNGKGCKRHSKSLK